MKKHKWLGKMGRLSLLEAKVIVGLSTGRPQREIAEEIGKSSQYVSKVGQRFGRIENQKALVNYALRLVEWSNRAWLTIGMTRHIKEIRREGNPAAVLRAHELLTYHSATPPEIPDLDEEPQCQ